MLFINMAEIMHSITIKSLNLSNRFPNLDSCFKILAVKPSRISDNPINSKIINAKIDLFEKYAKIKKGNKISLVNVIALGIVIMDFILGAIF